MIIVLSQREYCGIDFFPLKIGSPQGKYRSGRRKNPKSERNAVEGIMSERAIGKSIESPQGAYHVGVPAENGTYQKAMTTINPKQ